jgi:hypothetical protein
VTVAVKVTVAPYIEGFVEEFNATEEDWSTVCVNAEDVLEL